MKYAFFPVWIILIIFAVSGRAESQESLLQSLSQEIQSGEIELVDLSRPFKDGMPVFPGGHEFKLHPFHTLGKDIFYANWYEAGEHVGTHIDMPSHIVAGGKNADEISLAEFIAPACVIDTSEKAGRNPDYTVTVKDILKYEKEFGVIPENAVILLRTGWGKKWEEPSQYVNQDSAGTPHFPGFSAQTADWLLNHRRIRAIGIDTLSLDPGRSRDFPVHRLMHAAGKYMLENLDGLEKLPPKGALVMAFPIAIHKGSGAPARVVAFVKK